VPEDVVATLDSFGLSSLCNILAAIRIARHDGLGPDDAVLTVATDGATMYATERDRVLDRDFGGEFDEIAAAETFGREVLGAGEDHVLVLDEPTRRRIFNLGYFTWVEQQGVPFEAFVARREPAFWTNLEAYVPLWDELIGAFNARGSGSGRRAEAGARPGAEARS
jgi:hypothetical protein